jgi:hypothetical protein
LDVDYAGFGFPNLIGFVNGDMTTGKVFALLVGGTVYAIVNEVGPNATIVE